MSEKKRAVIAFLGNYYFDTRCFNLYNSLQKSNIEVKVISFDWLKNDLTSGSEEIRIHRLDKSKSSILFYLKFFFILTKELIKNSSHYYFAEDVYTLPIVSIIAKVNRAKVYYDSRELFDNLAGLASKRMIQRILSLTERAFIRFADYVIVTGEMDTEYLKKKYKLNNILCVRNLPLLKTNLQKVDLAKKFNLNKDRKTLLYQGVVLKGRGLPQIIEFVAKSEEYNLLILGDGEFIHELKSLAKKQNLEDKVIFAGRVSQSELMNITHSADVGLALIENLSLSYFYALPNKLFEYIMAEVPVIVSDLPQMKKIVNKYNVGSVCKELTVSEIQFGVEKIFNDYQKFKLNTIKAKQELHWESEVATLLTTL